MNLSSRSCVLLLFPNVILHCYHGVFTHAPSFTDQSSVPLSTSLLILEASNVLFAPYVMGLFVWAFIISQQWASLFLICCIILKSKIPFLIILKLSDVKTWKENNGSQNPFHDLHFKLIFQFFGCRHLKLHFFISKADTSVGFWYLIGFLYLVSYSSHFHIRLSYSSLKWILALVSYENLQKIWMSTTNKTTFSSNCLSTTSTSFQHKQELNKNISKFLKDHWRKERK